MVVKKHPGTAARRALVEMHSTSPNSSSRQSSDNTSEEPPPKRLKVEDNAEEPKEQSVTLPIVSSDSASVATILPPSHSLLGTAPPLQDESGAIIRLKESDVGISEYIAKHVPKIGGIIKQRYVLNLVLPKRVINNSKVHRLLSP